MNYWIVRNKITKDHLPYPKRGRKAKTHVELCSDRPPRLFNKKSQATQALKWWLDGKFMYKQSHSSFYEPEGSYLDREKVPTRIAEEMEIVQVKVEVS